MKYRLTLLITISSIFFSGLFAQRGSIEGLVIDATGFKPMEYAQVGLFGASDSSFVDGTISGPDGVFRLDRIRNGTYFMEVSFIGYKTESIGPIAITPQSTRYISSTVNLEINTTSLEEVAVIRQLSQTEREIDRQVFHAEQFQTATGGTAIDLLRNIPSVSIGPDGDVSLRGTQGFLVYLNGKPTQMDASVLLSQISANSIDRIEVITVPTAQFDAQGKGGIINITTHQSALNGTYLNTGIMVGGAPLNEMADPFRYGGNLSFTHQQKRLKVYGGLDYNSRDVRGSREGKARILQDDGSYYWMVADGPRPEWHINHSVRLGADIELSENDALTVGLYRGRKIEGRTAEYIYDNFYGDIDENRLGDPRDILIFNPNTHERVGYFTTASLDYLHESPNGGTFTGSFLYEYSNLFSDLYNTNISQMAGNEGDTLLAYRQRDDNPLNGFRLDLKYSVPIKNEHLFSVGYQPQYLQQQGVFKFDTLDVTNQVWNPYTEFENGTELSRWIHAGFINFQGSFDALDYIAGIRLEYMDQLFTVENPDYLNIFDRPTSAENRVRKLDFFPVLHLQYNLNETDKLVTAFSRRINRPPTKNMAPFLLRRHYEVFLVGDPSLKPEYANLAELSFVKGVGESQITLTGFYRKTSNAIYRVNTVLTEDESEWYHGNSVLIRSYTNSGNNLALGGELAADLKLTPWWKLYLGGSLYRFSIKGEIFEFEVDQQSTNWSLNANTSISMTSQFRFNWSISVQSATVTAQGEDELFYMSDASLGWIPKKVENINIQFKVLDTFSSNDKGLNTGGYDQSGTQIFYQTTTYHRYGPILELNLTYTLNTSLQKKNSLDSTFGKSEF
ncbi:MAG: outer membrane beta-barrel family protein [Bacteroidota bacterium]